MKISNNKKMWSQPAITSVELKNAANNTHTGLSKDGTATEYLYTGPGS